MSKSRSTPSHEGAHFKLRLYVAGEGPYSMQAIANLEQICREYVAGRHEIEVVDLLREPQRALDDYVMLTPVLVRRSPAPIRRVVGNLSDRESVVNAMGFLSPAA